MFSRFQSVQKVGFTGDAYKPGLSGMLRFSAMLGDPWKAYPCIHVAGTNGKGSVCSMLAAAMAVGEGVRRQADGQCADRAPLAGHGRALCTARMAICENAPSRSKIGLYTSPHLLDFRERMKIVSGDGFEMISREEVWEFLCLYEEAFEGLSFFEITTGMAFWWFARQGVDAAVIETGLGGRLDSTNIITPVLSIVTSIGLDHCALLGSTRAAIAREKAGIFKPGVPAVVGVRDAETAPVFEEVADAVGAPLVFASNVAAFSISFDQQESPKATNDSFLSESDLLSRMDLTGPCQDLNLHTVLVALTIPSSLLQDNTFYADLSRKTAFSLQVPPFYPPPVEKNAYNSTGTPILPPTCRENGGKPDRSEPGFEKDCLEVFDAIAEAGKRTGLWGRWQRICEKPEVICDIGHNPPALKENFARLAVLQRGAGWQETVRGGGRQKAVQSGDEQQPRQVILIYGIRADKDLTGIAPMMPSNAKYILVAPDNQRAMPAEELAARLKALRPDLDCAVSERPAASKAEAGRGEPTAEAGRGGSPAEGSVAAAVRQALDLAQDLPNPLVYIGGSTFVVAEALPLFNKNTAI